MNRPTAREINTAVYFLRAKQIGLSMDDLEQIDIGFMFDLMIEADNDRYDYPLTADQGDIDQLLA